MEHESNSTFVRHEPCANCGSSDALARYSDGHAHCFSCEYYEKGDGSEVIELKPSLPPTFIESEVRPINSRGLSEESCRKFSYGVGEYKGDICHVANYKDDSGKVIAQKLRFKDKSFKMLGKTPTLYGQHLWKDGGKFITVVEGEIDAISVSQAFGNKWPVVSVPNGAKGAAKAVRNSIEFLEQFDHVHFCFDNDTVGQEAVTECCLLLSPGKAKRVTDLPFKDANECLMEGKVKELINAIYSAKTFRPDGVVLAEDLWERMLEDDTIESVPYPWSGLNDLTHGMRQGELVTLCAGTGVGKSSVCRELCYWLMQQGHTVGYLALEESVTKTVRGLMGIELNKPPHYWEYEEETLKETFMKVTGDNRLVLYDHFGSIQYEHLLSKIRYMVLSMGATHIFLDHLSIVVSGIEESGAGNERRLIDNAMTKIRSMVEELGVCVFLVSHLSRTREGTSHEEGGFTSLSQLRGSHAIGQLSDIVVGLERNQQEEGGEAHITSLRVLKNRFSGETGIGSKLQYEPNTGRLHEYRGEENVDELSNLPL